jgi:hypothetical protein
MTHASDHQGPSRRGPRPTKVPVASVLVAATAHRTGGSQEDKERVHSRPTHKAALVGLLIVASLSLLLVGSASAATTRAFVKDFGLTLISETWGVGVDETSGNVLELRSFNSTSGTVSIYGPGGGAPIGVKSAVLPGTFSLNAQAAGLAVDNSSSSASRTVYVANPTESRVMRWRLNAAAEQYEAEPSWKTDGGNSLPDGIAVDSAGNVFVASVELGAPFKGSITEFDPAGNELLHLPTAPLGGPGGLAVAPDGDLFVEIYPSYGERDTTGGIYVFKANGSGAIEAGTEPSKLLNVSSRGIAVDPTNETLLVSGGKSVTEYDLGSLERLGSFGSHQLVESTRIAIDDSTGNVYVAQTGLNASEQYGAVVDQYGVQIPLPNVSTLAPSNRTTTSATLNGTVNPRGLELQGCQFEYGSTIAYGHVVACAESPQEIGTGEAPVPVHADLTGLQIGKHYHYRLVTTVNLADGSAASSEGDDAAFNAAGPLITETEVPEVDVSSALVQATVNANEENTSVFVQYLPESSFKISEWNGAAIAPASPKPIGNGSTAVVVTEELSGLLPLTSYRFRFVAQNGSGAAEGELEESGQEVPHAFTTYPSTRGLPDGRGYEQVSPTAKNGTSILGEPNSGQAASDGQALTFYTSGGIPGGVGAQEYPSFLAARSPSGTGWSTEGILPPATTGPFGKVIGWTENLREVFVSNKPQNEPATLYSRNSSTGALTEIASGIYKKAPYYFAGAAKENGVALFETPEAALTPASATDAPNVYVWDREKAKLRLASVLNDGVAPADGAFAGSYNWFHFGQTPIPPGGAAGTYYTVQQHALSADGSRVFFTAADTGPLYVRENPTRAQSPLDPGGKCQDPNLACTVRVSAPVEGLPDPGTPAAFVGAGENGEVAYFLDAGRLTQNASGTGAFDLYRYQVSSGALTDVTPLTPDAENKHGADVQGVIGMSRDGSTIYFVANGVLADGATPGSCVLGEPIGECNLYVANSSGIDFIAKIGVNGAAQSFVARDLLDWAPSFFFPGGRVLDQAARVSADGQTVLFTSQKQLTTRYANAGVPEIYRYHAGTINCVSCNPTGAAPKGDASLQANPGGYVGPSLTAPVLARNLSPDGNRVFFDSADRLVANDTNGVNDVYEWEAAGTGSCAETWAEGGCIYLISGGNGPQPSYFADADVNGDNAFFLTYQRLVGQDQDEIADAYDARVGGGIPSQNPTSTVPCEGEACAGVAQQAPKSSSPGSSTFNGPGNKTTKPKKTHHRKKRHQAKHPKKRKNKHQKNGRGNHKRRGAGR